MSTSSRWMIYSLAIAVLPACATTRAIDYGKYGQHQLPFASPLTEFEAAVLTAVKGHATPQSLFDLALVMGGAVRTQQAADPLRQKFDAFITSTKKALSSTADPRQRGLALFKAFHASLLGSIEGKPELTNYEIDQTTIDGILKTGDYNCISSAILFGLAAQHFGFEAMGVLVPSHVFIELRHKKTGKTYEVETTSISGFDVVHDKAFFKTQSRKWAAMRGLEPITLQDYRNRKKISLLRLIASMYNVQHTHEGVMAPADKVRLVEIAGFLCDDASCQRDRLATWSNLLTEMLEMRHYVEVIRITKKIEAVLLRVVKQTDENAEFREIAIAILDRRAIAESRLGRHTEAMQTAMRIDRLFNEKTLRQNRIYVFQEAAKPKFDKGDWPGAIKVLEKCHKGIASDDFTPCHINLQGAYMNWAGEYLGTGNRQKATDVLDQCIAKDARFAECQGLREEMRVKLNR